MSGGGTEGQHTAHQELNKATSNNSDNTGNTVDQKGHSNLVDTLHHMGDENTNFNTNEVAPNASDNTKELMPRGTPIDLEHRGSETAYCIIHKRMFMHLGLTESLPLLMSKGAACIRY